MSGYLLKSKIGFMVANPLKRAPGCINPNQPVYTRSEGARRWRGCAWLVEL